MEIIVNDITYTDTNTPCFILEENFRSFSTKGLSTIAVEGDNDSSAIFLTVPRYWHNIDLSSINALIYWSTSWVDDEGKPSQNHKILTNKIEEENQITYLWQFDENQTYKSGTVEFGISWSDDNWTLNTKKHCLQINRFVDTTSYSFIAPTVVEELRKEIDSVYDYVDDKNQQVEEEISGIQNYVQDELEKIKNPILVNYSDPIELSVSELIDAVNIGCPIIVTRLSHSGQSDENFLNYYFSRYGFHTSNGIKYYDFYFTNVVPYTDNRGNKIQQQLYVRWTNDPNPVAWTNEDEGENGWFKLSTNFQDSVLVAIYNSTSYEDIKAAYDANKAIICKNITTFFNMTSYSNGIFNFYKLDITSAGLQIAKFTVSSSGYTLPSYSYITIR